MKRAQPLLLLALVALVAVVVSSEFRETAEEAPPIKEAPTESLPNQRDPVRPRTDPSDGDRTPLVGSKPGSERIANPDEAVSTSELPLRPTASGRVLDPAGLPLAGMRLALLARTAGEVATSEADGRFAFAIPPEPDPALATVVLELAVATDQNFTSALRTTFTLEDRTEILAVAAPSIELGGIVTDEVGLPVSGVTVRLEIAPTDLRGFPLPLDGCLPLVLTTTSGDDGVFRLSPVPAIEGCRLEAVARDSRRAELELPLQTRMDLQLVLRPDEHGVEETLTGQVFDSDGGPVGGATVVLEASRTTSGADGTFAIPLPSPIADDSSLFAIKEGFQPARLEGVSARIAAGDVTPVVLQLGPPTLEIRGQVLLSDGSPARRWVVSLDDGTTLSTSGDRPLTVEGLAAGAEVDEKPRGTNARGEFTLRGLSDRRYTVRATNSDTLLSVRAVDVQAGTDDLVLTVPDDATWPEIRGRVVDLRGAPIEGALVTVESTAVHGARSGRSRAGLAATTDATGTFRLRNVPRNDVRLVVAEKGWITQEFLISELQPERELRLALPHRCNFRVIGQSTENAPDRAIVLDETGEPLPISGLPDDDRASRTEIPLVQGSSTSVLAVSETARTLVLLREQAEVGRVTIGLLVGQVTDLRY